MRYFLDCEFNGFGGELISFALVPDDGGEEFYARVEMTAAPVKWVERHVMPFVDHVPVGLQCVPAPLADVAAQLEAWLRGLDAVEIVADWPEDIALFCRVLSFAPAEVIRIPPVTFRWLSLPGFSTARNSAVPHNALHDARALRDHVLGHLE